MTTFTDLDDQISAEEPSNAEQTAHYETSDLGNARRLVDQHGHDLRHAPQLGTWYAWDGRRWAEDLTFEAQRRAKTVGEVVLNEARGSGDGKVFNFGLKAQSAAGINNLLTLAATEPGIPILTDQMDTDPMVLNVANGTIDLATGELRPHRRRDLITELAPVAYNPDAVSPLWMQFLDELFLNDQDLIGFVRRYAGYSLTGDVSEQVLAFCWGTGANGKSTMLNALRHVVGDYGMQLDPAILTVSTHEQHPTGLSDLRGARLVSTIETEQGRRVNEPLVKQLTGGDPIRARRMHRDFFEFQPSHKLWFAGNHLPRIDGTDAGIWRRLALIPFQASFIDRPDKTLPGRLAAEAPGILAWAVQGCLEWQRDGLQVPEAVTTATNEYRTTQDHVGRFLADACVEAPSAYVPAKELRSAYEDWCSEQGERPWTAQALGRELNGRGYDTAKMGNKNTRTWCGIGLSKDYE